MIKITPCTSGDFPVQDNLFQSAFWGKFKNNENQKSLYFFADYNEKQFPLLVLLRQTKSGYSYAYAPKAPSIFIEEEERGIFLEQLSLELKKFLPEKIICIRYDIPWISSFKETSDVRKELLDLRMNFGTETSALRKAPVDHLCPNTVLINLSYSPEQLLERMRQTTRNSVRRSYRSEVVFRRYTAEQALSSDSPLKKWHEIYKDTATRKNFYFEEYDYFEKLLRMNVDENKKSNEPYSFVRSEGKNPVPLEAPAPDPKFYLFTANLNEQVLSGLILAICSHQAYYMYAGSSLECRELMPNYGLQWEAQLFARSSGCTQYDLMGIPPNNDLDHPMHGLFIFKTGFGGTPVHFLGCWDYVYNFDSYKYFTIEEQFSN